MKLLTPQSLSPGLSQQMAEREMETKVCKFKVKASHLQNIKLHAAVLPSQKLRK